MKLKGKKIQYVFVPFTKKVIDDRRYGAPKIHIQLLKEGVKVSIKRVQLLMKKAGIRLEHHKKAPSDANTKARGRT